jgi:uncharacterized protein (TIGR03435 family)
MIVLSINMGWTQSGAGTPAFEAAVVKVNSSGDIRAQGTALRGGQLTWRNLTMKTILNFAFANYAFAGGIVRFDQFEGGPDWLGSSRFDITAKSPNDTPPQTVQIMLQNLLIDQLKLQFHRESRVKPVYALTVGKQLRLQESSGPGAAGCATVDGAQDQNHKDCKQMTMAALADALPQLAPLYFDRPIVDVTGLKGIYDFKLDWAAGFRRHNRMQSPILAAQFSLTRSPARPCSMLYSSSASNWRNKSCRFRLS